MFELLDRFGNKIQPVAKESIDLNVCGIEFKNIELMDVDHITEIHAMLLEEGKALVGNFNEDLITEETFQTGINITIANVGVLLMLIKEKNTAVDARKAEETIEFVGNKCLGGI